MAAGLLGDLLLRRGRTDIEVASAGTAAMAGDPAAAHAVTVLGERGIDLGGHRARRLTGYDLDTVDLILTMTEGHKRSVLEFAPETADRVFTVKEAAALAVGEIPGLDLDIYDPVGGPLDLYRDTADELAELLEIIADNLDYWSLKEA
jgi:protein-tyrosine-phosphatase